jgi:uncharacterized membrane protein YccC
VTITIAQINIVSQSKICYNTFKDSTIQRTGCHYTGNRQRQGNVFLYRSATRSHQHTSSLDQYSTCAASQTGTPSLAQQLLKLIAWQGMNTAMEAFDVHPTRFLGSDLFFKQAHCEQYQFH